MGTRRPSMAQEVNDQPMDGRSRIQSELALFAGALGGGLGSWLLGRRIVAAVEIEPYAREVLMARQEDGTLPPFPIFDDIDNFDGTLFRGKVDKISAGFPCQGWSVSGRQLGEKDPRNKWPDTLRVISEVRPSEVLLENVPGIRKYIGTVVSDLATLGYDSEYGIVSAREAGAPHLRKRWWCIAYPRDQRMGEELANRHEE